MVCAGWRFFFEKTNWAVGRVGVGLDASGVFLCLVTHFFAWRRKWGGRVAGGWVRRYYLLAGGRSGWLWGCKWLGSFVKNCCRIVISALNTATLRSSGKAKGIRVDVVLTQEAEGTVHSDPAGKVRGGTFGLAASALPPNTRNCPEGRTVYISQFQIANYKGSLTPPVSGSQTRPPASVVGQFEK